MIPMLPFHAIPDVPRNSFCLDFFAERHCQGLSDSHLLHENDAFAPATSGLLGLVLLLKPELDARLAKNDAFCYGKARNALCYIVTYDILYIYCMGAEDKTVINI